MESSIIGFMKVLLTDRKHRLSYATKLIEKTIFWQEIIFPRYVIGNEKEIIVLIVNVEGLYFIFHGSVSTFIFCLLFLMNIISIISGSICHNVNRQERYARIASNL